MKTRSSVREAAPQLMERLESLFRKMRALQLRRRSARRPVQEQLELPLFPRA